ncbi:MAG: protein kinase [Clostridiales bacterium]|nr:protein kinase [Clostridiales bacterium]
MEQDILSRAWPEWKAVKELGRGSYGVVYEAVRMDHQVESRAAIKVISIPQNESEIDSLRSEGMTLDASKTYLRGVVDDFVSEIQVMESFKGIQNIVSVEDYKVVEKENQIGWDIFIRMELLTSFNKYICDKTLTEAEVIKLGCDICTALEFCAKRNVIHRDIKPENIFVNDFGDFKLGDFGIARKLESVTGGYSQKGTFNYMAPEVEKGTEYDARVDLYSLGLVLYRFMNKNRLPFLDTDRQLLNPNDRVEAVRRRMSGEALPLPCDASPDMAQVILCACAYDPRRRFSTATAMKTALLNVNGGMDYVSRDDLNKTVSVRSAAGQAQEKTETTGSTESTYEKSNTGKREDNRSDRASSVLSGGKKSKKRKIIVIVIVIAVLAAAAVYAVPNYLGLGSVTDVLPIGNNEAERIQEILDEAAALAESDDYEGALAVIQEGLEEYPDSEELLAKEEEYENELAEQAKAEILAKAEEYAASGKYAMALNLIKTQDGYETDVDYQDAYSRYSESYKTEVLATAEEKAEEGDYLSAINKITDAQKAVDEFETDDELQAALTTYENQYVADVISQVDGYISAGDYDSAEAALTEALNLFPDNTKLQDEDTVLEDSKAVEETATGAEEQSFLSLCTPYQSNNYETGTYTIMGESYYGFLIGYSNGYAWYNLTKDLGGQYTILSFDVGHIDGSGNYSSTLHFFLGDNNDEVTEFYVDGERVSKLTLSPSMSMQHVEISIEDANKLIIEGDSYSYQYALVNITVK